MDVTQRLAHARRPFLLLAALRAENLPLALGLAVTLTVAVGLRFYALGWDTGYSYTPHPDERAILMRVSDLSLPALGDLGLLFDADESPWNPRWFPYGSFPLYLLKGVQLASSALPGAELTDLRLAGRAISALADVGTVAMVFLLGSRIYGRREGLLAAALIALAVLHIQLSHFYAVDTLLSLFTVVAIYFMYQVAREGRLRDSLLAGLFIGVGLGTKVSQAPIYLVFVMAHLVFLFSANETAGVRTGDPGYRLRAALKGLAGGLAASVAVLVVVQPYAFLDWSRFYADIVEQSEMVRRIRDYPYTRQYIDTTPYWYHVHQLATWGLGWPLGLVAWGGLAYASLRGARLRYGLAYLAAGWGLPMALLLVSTSFFAIVVASGIAFLALLAYLPLRSPDTRADLLLLAWVAPYLMITGALEVKFLRYLIPITPFLILFGSRMLFALWDWVAPRSRQLRPLLVGGLVLLVGSTALYAFSYAAIYAESHTAVRTSDWLNSNAPEGAVLLKEHWEEGLPDLEGFEIRDLPLYEDDTPAKVDLIAERLAGADYLVFFSNRLYGTIPRLPGRYPSTTEYYRLLFSGELGYELAYAQTAYPRVAGVSLAHDTFARPGLAPPAGLAAFEPAGPTLNLGFADESFSVYDHPTGLVFENVGRLDADTIEALIEDATGVTAVAATPRAPTAGLLSPEDAEAQRRGGTWSEIVRVGSWTNGLPVLAWLIVVEGLALLAWPVGFLVFRPLADRGYLLSKVLGLLAVSLVVWLLASTHWMAFSSASVSLAVLLLSASATVVLARRHREITAFVRERWPILLIGEAVFLVAFLAFVLVRMANPDLWHPHLGGEKPMDQAYLNAVLRSSYMPPYDPWFAGGYMNYYYWGQFVVATLIRATGIDPAVAFNLGVALFFALTAGGAFAIVYNLAEGTRRARLAALPDGGRRTAWSPVLAGVTGALFVTVLGNLDGAVQVGQGVWRAVVRNMPFGTFDFWRSSRMMPPGNEITEFPFFTFLFGDLHAHLMALPFTLLVVGVALATVLAVRRRSTAVRGEPRQSRGSSMESGPVEPRTAVTAQATWSAGEIARLAVLGVAVGSLRVINTWDYPTYLLVAVAAVFLAEYFRTGGVGLVVLVRSGVKALIVFSAGYLAFLPFHLSYEAPFDAPFGIFDATTDQTVLWQFLGIAGLFIFIIASFFISESRDWLLPWWRAIEKRVKSAVVVSGSGPAGPAVDETRRIAGVRVAALALGAAAIGFVVSITLSGWLGSTIPFLIVIESLVLVAAVGFLRSCRADAPYLAFAAVLVGMSLMLAIGLDIFRIRDDIDRMNSIFKFYLQVWVMLALASAYLLWRLGHGRKTPLLRLPAAKKLWLVGLAALVVSAAVYPVLGTQARLRTRFDVLPMTLDGAAYMQGAVYLDENGEIEIASDYEGIRWLQRNLEGSPVMLEGFTPQYRWGARVSVYTGLPSVIGWKWHQEQQRWNYREAVDQRVRDVDTIYSTTDASEALSLMGKYGVEYVYVGQMERLYYPADGLAKFDGELSAHLDRVFQNDHVDIYRLHDAEPSAAVSR